MRLKRLMAVWAGLLRKLRQAKRKLLDRMIGSFGYFKDAEKRKIVARPLIDAKN